jgi:cis-3-alkyl-4-acyloxetan-2-one decarboxylase
MQASCSLHVEGIPVQVQGAQAPVLAMVHGWPDTAALWDLQWPAFTPHFCCVRFTLPGFDKHHAAQPPRRQPNLPAMVQWLAAVLDAVSPQAPVWLMAHDWGAVYSLALARQRPERVAGLLLIDVADAFSPAWRAEVSWREKLMVAAYQLPLALSGALPPRWGDALTRRVARLVGCRSPQAAIGACMNFPYAQVWSGHFAPAAPGAAAAQTTSAPPSCPVWFAHGLHKPMRFHTQAWLHALSARADCRAVPFAAGHWLMRQQPEAFNAAALDWLSSRAVVAARHPPAST